VAISEKNISNWRKTGFKRWQERQELLAEVRELAEEAADLNEANPDGLMRMTATLACTKLLRSLRDAKSGADVAKMAFAIAALNNVEMSHVRVDHEDRRLQQKDSLVELAWDKHMRSCAVMEQREMEERQAKAKAEEEVDYSQQIELIGRHMFGDLWKKRRLPWEDENFNKDEKELERMEAERQAKAGSTGGPSPDDGCQRTEGTNWTDGTDEPDSPSLPVNPYGDKTTDQLMAEAESLSRNCRNTGSTCGPNEETAENIEQKETKTTEAAAPRPSSEPSPHPYPLPSHRMGAEREQQLDGVCSSEDQQHASVVPSTTIPQAADQQVSPTVIENVTAAEGASGETGETPVPLAEAEPEYNLRDIERLMRFQGKTLEEARQILRARLKAWKAWRKKGSMGPNPMHAAPEPNYFAPNPGPTPPLCGPCEPPLTSASLRNLW
jgi:hypothetical protein